MDTIITEESKWNPNTVGDGGYSFGLVQINTKYHDITREQALDPDFSLRFVAQALKDGNEDWLFTACNCYQYMKLFKKVPKMADIVPNTTPSVGSIAIFYYKGVKHIAYVTALEAEGFFVKEGNYKKCKKTTRFISYTDPALKGFFL